MTKAQKFKVDDILTATIKTTGTTWGEIVEAVSNEMKIKNWLGVRGVVQFQIDEREIARTKNVHEEIYIRLV